VWDAKTGAELRKLVGHDRVVRAVAVTPDGARIITGSDDKTARVWDASTGAQLLKLEGHTSAVLAVAVTPVPASSPARATEPYGCGMQRPEPNCSSSKATRAL
jgi:WD40 repeat protein